MDKFLKDIKHRVVTHGRVGGHPYSITSGPATNIIYIQPPSPRFPFVNSAPHTGNHHSNNGRRPHQTTYSHRIGPTPGIDKHGQSHLGHRPSSSHNVGVNPSSTHQPNHNAGFHRSGVDFGHRSNINHTAQALHFAKKAHDSGIQATHRTHQSGTAARQPMISLPNHRQLLAQVARAKTLADSQPASRRTVLATNQYQASQQQPIVPRKFLQERRISQNLKRSSFLGVLATVIGWFSGTARAETIPRFQVRAEERPRLDPLQGLKVSKTDQVIQKILTTFVSQFDRQFPKEEQQEACLKACVVMCNQNMSKNQQMTRDRDARIMVSIGKADNSAGRIKANPIKAAQALAYIDRLLNQNLRVLVGVSFGHPANPENDPVTGHFVVIIGRNYEPDGRVFYTFLDPGTAGGKGREQYQESRFYVDTKTGILFRRGAQPSSSKVVQRDYEVSHVRLNPTVKP